MSTTSRQFFVRLTIIVVVWYLGLVFLPQIAGTCLDGECGFSTGEIIVSFAIPLGIVAATVLLEVLLYNKNVLQALSDIGVTRFTWGGIRIAAIYLLPLLVFFPLYALFTNTPLATQPNWQWLILNTLLTQGLAEEIMMRGFVFRHLREGRPFWRAAALSTIYFAAYHVMLIFYSGALVGIIAVIIAIPAGFLTAYIYERGDNTIWGSALFHALFNIPTFFFAFPTGVQPIATSMYLVVGIVVSTLILILAYQAGYGGRKPQTGRGVTPATETGAPLPQ